MTRVVKVADHTATLRALRALARVRRWVAGARLPSARELAVELGCTRWRMAAALAELESVGLLRRQGYRMWWQGEAAAQETGTARRARAAGDGWEASGPVLYFASPAAGLRQGLRRWAEERGAQVRELPWDYARPGETLAAIRRERARHVVLPTIGEPETVAPALAELAGEGVRLVLHGWACAGLTCVRWDEARGWAELLGGLRARGFERAWYFHGALAGAAALGRWAALRAGCVELGWAEPEGREYRPGLWDGGRIFHRLIPEVPPGVVVACDSIRSLPPEVASGRRWPRWPVVFLAHEDEPGTGRTRCPWGRMHSGEAAALAAELCMGSGPMHRELWLRPEPCGSVAGEVERAPKAAAAGPAREVAGDAAREEAKLLPLFAERAWACRELGLRPHFNHARAHGRSWLGQGLLTTLQPGWRRLRGVMFRIWPEGPRERTSLIVGEGEMGPWIEGDAEAEGLAWLVGLGRSGRTGEVGRIELVLENGSGAALPLRVAPAPGANLQDWYPGYAQVEGRDFGWVRVEGTDGELREARFLYVLGWMRERRGRGARRWRIVLERKSGARLGLLAATALRVEG